MRAVALPILQGSLHNITPHTLRHELRVIMFHVTVLLDKFSCSVRKVVHEYSFILALFTVMVVTDSCISQLLNCKQNNSSFDWHLGEIFGSRMSKMMVSRDMVLEDRILNHDVKHPEARIQGFAAAEHVVSWTLRQVPCEHCCIFATSVKCKACAHKIT